MNKPIYQSLTFFIIFLLFSSSSAHDKPKDDPSSSSTSKGFKGCFPKVYAFGDSDTDTGNAPLLGSHFQGVQTYNISGTIPSRLVIDFLCAALALPPPPPFLKGLSGGSESGINFAISGSTSFSADVYGKNLTSLFWKGIPENYKTQIDWFNKYVNQAKGTEAKGTEGQGNEGKGNESKGSEGKGTEGQENKGKGNEGQGNQGNSKEEGKGQENQSKGKEEGKGTEGQGSQGKGTEGSQGKGTEGQGNQGKGSHKADMANALFWIGQMGVSDYTSTQGSSSISLRALAELSVKHVTELLTEIIKNGGKYIIVQGLPPVGCFPLYMSSSPLNTLDKAGCAATINAAVSAHNQILQWSLEKYRKMYPNCKIAYADYWNAYLAIATNPKKYGIQEPFKACCGSGEGQFNFNKNKMCGTSGTSVCKDPSKYVNFDGCHLTEAMHKHLADMFLHQGFCQPSFDELVKSKKGV